MSVCSVQRRSAGLLALFSPPHPSCFRIPEFPAWISKSTPPVQRTTPRRARLSSQRTTTENWGAHAIEIGVFGWTQN